MRAMVVQRVIFGIAVVIGEMLSGCAVLTVDVDVYKGALMNEEHVQVHQLVALAIAANPMLVQLRDELEWPSDNGKPAMDVNWYRSRYVPEPGYITDYNFFQKPLARKVNAILSLYEDITPPDLTLAVKRLNEAWDRFQRAKQAFGPSPAYDKTVFERINNKLKPDEELEKTSNLKDLKEAYKELLVSTDSFPLRKVGKLMDALQSLSKSFQYPSTSGLEKDLLEHWEGSDKYKDKNNPPPLYERRLPFRAVWKLLGEEPLLLWRVTGQLCAADKEGERACLELRTRTKELADAYWDSRLAIRELWEASASLLIAIERLDRKGNRWHQALKEDVISLVVEMTSVQQVASALERVQERNKCVLLTNPSEGGLSCSSEGEEKWTEENVKKSPEQYKMILRHALSRDSIGTSQFLLDLNSLEKTVVPKTTKMTNIPQLVAAANASNTKRFVRLGLNQNYIDDDGQGGIQGLVMSLEAVRRNLAQGLERGRLLEGIYYLTEDYLKIHDEAHKNGMGGAKDTERKAENKLLDALVEFAQKILFLANHEGLSSPPETPGLVTGGTGKISRGLFGDMVTDRVSPFMLFPENLSQGKRNQYVQYTRVLQAVGNSILFSANELRERERHRVEGRGKVNAEVNAVNLSLSYTPKKVFETLLIELDADKAAVEAKKAAVQTRKDSAEERLKDLSHELKDLNNKKAAANTDKDAAQRVLEQYQEKNKTLKALREVLTDEIIASIKDAWKKDNKVEANNLPSFFSALSDALERTKNSKGTTLSQSQENTFTEAGTYLKTSGAKQAFEDQRALAKNRPWMYADILDEFVEHIKGLEQDRIKEEQDLDKKKTDAEQKLKVIQKQIADLTKQQDDLAEEHTNLEAQIKNYPGKLVKIEKAIKKVTSLKEEVLQFAADQGQLVSPEGLHLYLQKLLESKKAATQDIQETTQFQDAIDMLSKHVPPPAWGPLKVDDYKDRGPLAVMDEVIALLRHRQIKDVERFGKGSEQDIKAMQALENAYQQRAGMLYIRPSSAYLRTSYPSTSLQDDPNLAWDNMLLSQGLRAMPFSSQLRDIIDPDGRRDRLITAELDKQHWQNINRVRISGAGFTNYAVAKDDVGNWYVKSYYGNTDDIIKSAKNLALFNLGAKLPINLAEEIKAASKPADGTEGNGTEPPPLNRVLAKHRNAYYEKTADDIAKLDELRSKNTIRDRIRNAWMEIQELKGDESSNDTLNRMLDSALRRWEDDVDEVKNKKDQDRGVTIVREIRALARFGKSLASDAKTIDKEPKPNEKLSNLKSTWQKAVAARQEAEKNGDPDVKKKDAEGKAKKEMEDEEGRLLAVKTKAARKVTKIVGTTVLDLLKDRKQTLDNYEQALLFIGDATK